LLASLCLLLTSSVTSHSRPTRLAVLDFGKTATGLHAAAAIRSTFQPKEEPREFAVIDPDQTSAAALGAGAVDVAQPDLGSCGGISAGRHIIALAQSHGVQINPHVWGSAIAQAASLQFLAAVPVAHHSLFAQEPILEYDRSSHPFRQHLITTPIRQVDGWVEIPSGPGLGVEVDRNVLEKFRA